MSLADYSDDEKCDHNPQTECSLRDGGAACLRNEDNTGCCGGECTYLGDEGVCPPCDEDANCNVDGGFVCCP